MIVRPAKLALKFLMFGLFSTVALFGFGKKQAFDSKALLVGNFTLESLSVASPDTVDTRFVTVKPQDTKVVLEIYDVQDGELQDTYYLDWQDSANFSIYKDEELQDLIAAIVFTEEEQVQVARGSAKGVSYKLTLFGQKLELLIYDAKNGITKVTFTSSRPPLPWWQQYMSLIMLLPMIINMFLKKPMQQPPQPQQPAAGKKEEKDGEKKEENDGDKKEEGKGETKDGETKNDEAKKGEAEADDGKVKKE